MFKRLLALTVMTALMLVPMTVRAAEKDGPTVMIRVQSIEKTLDMAEYLVGLAGQDADQAKQGLAFAKLLIGDKGIEGIDTKRPFVIYATIAGEIQESQVVVMAPIADQDAFLNLLKNRAGLKPSEKDGVYSVEVPNSPAPVYFRFANKYLYATIQSKENIDEKKLPKPSEVTGKETGVLSIAVRADRFPEQMKKFALGYVEQMLAEAKKTPIPNETDAIKALKEKSIDSLVAGIQAAMFESKEMTIKFDIDPKKDEIAMEFDVTAVDGSSLAKDFKAWKADKSVVMGALSKQAAIVVGMNFGLPASVKKAMSPVVDELVKMGLNMAPGEAQELLEPLVKAVTPTLKDGQADGAMALMGPNKKNLYTYVQAIKIKDGLKIEAAIKEVIKKIPNADAFVEVDAESIGDTKIHVIKVPAVDENAKKIFGESNAYLAFRSDMVIVVFGPDYKEAIKTLLTSKPSEGPLAKFSVNGYRMIGLAESMEPGAGKLAKEMFGKSPEEESFYAILEAGDSLKARVAIKGSAIKFFAAMDKAKKAKN